MKTRVNHIKTATKALRLVAAHEGPLAPSARRALKALRRNDYGDGGKAVAKQISDAIKVVADLNRRADAVAGKVKRPAADTAARAAANVVDPELARIDRRMMPFRTVAERAERRGTTLYLGRAPEGT